MRNKIRYDIKVNMALKTALIGIVKKNVGDKIALNKSGCTSTEYEIVTAGVEGCMVGMIFPGNGYSVTYQAE